MSTRRTSSRSMPAAPASRAPSRAVSAPARCGGPAIVAFRVHLGHILTAVALNFLRLGEWFPDVPRAKLRTSPFALLMLDVAAA